ncbi:putative vacuolar membrane protein [Meyerozyma sp. JA9]|nr:putative vacuolar membrane protein [Meyerozyma sp. JA9]
MSYSATEDHGTETGPKIGSQPGSETGSEVHARPETTSPVPERSHVAEERYGRDSDLEREPLVRRNFLDPDDPRVSPMNLYRIRALRFAIACMLWVNVVLFFIFLISDFVAIPGLNNRGKSFLQLDLLILNFLTNLITLWSFTVPAYYERILGYVSGGLLFIDFIVVISVPYLRDQFGLTGNLLMLWTLLTVAVNCWADYSVEKSKKNQEIELTGRIETRHSIWELFVMLIKIVIKLFLLLVLWNVSLGIWLQAFDSHEQPWGKMVAVDNNQFKVHLACFGDVGSSYNGTQPIVMVEGGQLTSAEEFQEWIEELYHLNRLDRYCVWDRPGYGFSDSAPSPISINIITEYLMEALGKEKIDGPFSVVGFDIGGLYARAFASRNSHNIHSVMLVDSWHEDLLKLNPFSGPGRKNEKKKVFRNILELMNTRTGFKLWLKGLVAPLGLVTNTHWFFHPKRYSSNSRIFGSDMVRSSKYLRARLQEQITASILSHNEMAGSDIHSVPLSVVSSDFMIKKSLNWGKWQRELTKLSSKALEWVVAEKSGHKIWESPRGREELQKVLLRLLGDSEI